MHILQKPTAIFLLPEGVGVRRFSPEEVEAFLTRYEDTGWEPKLERLYKSLSCDTVDMRVLRNFGQVWFDDEGKLKDRSLNPVASVLYATRGGGSDTIVGPAILIADPAFAPDQAVENLLAALDRAFRDQFQTGPEVN